jgi:ribosomal protein S18 acetylase RimI-like enzyme
VSIKKRGNRALARRILKALPEWFARPEAIARYLSAAASLPMAAVSESKSEIGFFSIKFNTEAAAEYVGGVLPEFHRQGYGRALINKTEEFAKEHGRRYLTVKSYPERAPSKPYYGTLCFYKAVGFEIVEEFEDFWGPGRACLYLVKPI